VGLCSSLAPAFAFSPFNFMTSVPLFVAEGGILESLSASAEQTGLTFGFNAWLFFSQVISFCIVAFLLQRFAYKPILTVLEQRRQKIADGLANAAKIKQQLTESEQRYEAILTKANAEAQKMIDDARASAAILKEKETLRATTEAEQILAKAREAARMEHARMLAELKRELGRMVIGTTAKVTGKVLTAEDQKKISSESAQAIVA